MKNVLLSLMFITTVSVVNHSQAQAFDMGNKVFSVGYGFPNLNKSLFKSYEDYADFKVTGYGPLHLKFEYGISERVGIGLSINHVSSAVSYKDSSLNSMGNMQTYDYKMKWNSTKFNARVNYHFSNSDVFDAYVGVGFGYGFSGAKWTTNDPDADNLSFKSVLPIGFETTLGGRYYFSDQLGAYAEVGLAKSVVQFGLVLKLE